MCYPLRSLPNHSREKVDIASPARRQLRSADKATILVSVITQTAYFASIAYAWRPPWESSKTPSKTPCLFPPPLPSLQCRLTPRLRHTRVFYRRNSAGGDLPVTLKYSPKGRTLFLHVFAHGVCFHCRKKHHSPVIVTLSPPPTPPPPPRALSPSERGRWRCRAVFTPA